MIEYEIVNSIYLRVRTHNIGPLKRESTVVYNKDGTKNYETWFSRRLPYGMSVTYSKYGEPRFGAIQGETPFEEWIEILKDDIPYGLYEQMKKQHGRLL